MKKIKMTAVTALLLFVGINIARGQLRVRVEAGQIYLKDLVPNEAKYKSISDSLDQKLKINPNDTTSLFYRSMLYLQFNSLKARPDLTTNIVTDQLLAGKKLADRADSLGMKNLNLKIIRAQLCKELTFRYAPADTWRFNTAQMASRRQKFEYYKASANRQYDLLADLDKAHSSDYQRLKVK
ncbi:hypothetical protein DIU31_031515 [Mucilaginibacter rubeus]|uniref:Uncharacterized protein n=1 Tax=Mucilaginibacter rubeus TaxID=2027860 RepID=A0AAE6JLP4_9SPHI|nr:MULTISPECIES: hypothetical protein [Mucilaginibacter]QEM07810.1 hypothetical protein DIU31_031515 [Mucilaginibacter rubeus]QEM20262.1 hypothetical protein DIU38_031120 [Mucilaginibacter gossypii]QTE43021.1 hypothetical protein J3L19_29550 [Mucilaginibacter rubeus]QTE49622.1 hypothetical protein J3L21_29510 [Mucilaginibacter rubeus]QTE54717.1 hypothetical protein J3L23_21130 [Mucilaginibacter rubeus]